MESINSLTLIKIEIQSRYSQTRKSKQVIEWRKYQSTTELKNLSRNDLLSFPRLTITIKNGNWRPVYSSSQ